MLPQVRNLASGSFVPSKSLNSGMSRSGRVAISLAREQFWGRAVQASRDSLDPGRFLFVEVSPRTPSFHFQTILLKYRDYFPASSEKIGASSLFPDDKLR
jgi:hypothetical protein